MVVLVLILIDWSHFDLIVLVGLRVLDRSHGYWAVITGEWVVLDLGLNFFRVHCRNLDWIFLFDSVVLGDHNSDCVKDLWFPTWWR